MKIAVNARFLLPNKLEGIGWFTHEVLQRIVKAHPEHEFVFFFDRKYDERFVYADNVKPMVLHPQSRHPFLWYLWFEHAVPSALKAEKPDLFLSTDSYLSLKTDVPTTLVVHDLAFEHHPQDVGYLVRKYYKHYVPKFVEKASRIATVSEYSKQDIVTQYGTSPDKIDVVYNGANPMYKPLSEEEQKKVKVNYTGGQDFFLFVGAIHPRKNIARLFKAFDEFKKASNSPMKLVLVGRKGWSTDEIEQTYNAMNYKQDVVFTGRLSSDDLAKVLASATAMTYVPYFEGFGIPILEAQYADTPVITSNITSMPEVAGSGAHLVDPYSVDSIKEGLLKVALDKTYRDSLREEGRENRLRFSWDKTAEKVWACMEKSLC